MATHNWRTPEIGRVLVYTLAIALGFVLLGRAQVALFAAADAQGWLQRAGVLDADPAPKLQREIAEVAAASAGALQQLGAGHRVAALRLGYELGYVSQWLGVRAMNPEPDRVQAEQRMAPYRRSVENIAAQWGLGDATPLPSATMREFLELGERYEADENGLAGRIAARMSPLHRHLYLLGVHLGGEAAKVEDSGGAMALPPGTLIARHATLAGIGPALWRPLVERPRAGEAPHQVLQRYRAALQQLQAAVDAQDRTAPPR